MGLVVHAATAENKAENSKNFTTFVYAMCSLVFDKSYAVYFSFDGSTRSILETLKLPPKYSKGFIRDTKFVGIKLRKNNRIELLQKW